MTGAAASAGPDDRAGAGLAPVLLLILALVAFLPGIATLPVTDRDEARFAQAARQMAVSGDWVDIRFQDAPRHKKPAGIYWAQAAVLKALGQGEGSAIWAHRLPSVAGAALACLALAWAGRPLVGRRAALIAGAMLAGVLILGVEARIAKTDAALLLAVILAMGGLARAWLGTIRGWAVPALFWTALAAGVLLKGPVILLPVGATALWLLGLSRRARWLAALRPLPGILWAVALAAPWYIAIIRASDGGFLAEAIGRDFAAKLGAGQEGHGAPPGSYLAAALLTLWPWTALLPLAAVHAWAARAEPAVLFLLGWILPAWAVLEAVPTKLPHYTMPLYPALLLLAAAAAVAAGRLRGWPLALGVLAWLPGTGALAALMVLGPARLGAGPDPVALSGAVFIAVAGAVGLVWLVAGRVGAGIGGLLVSGIGGLWILTLTAFPAMDDLWVSPRLAAATARHDCLTGPVYLVGYHEPSAVFLLGTATRLSDEATARAALAETPGARAWIARDGADPAGVEGETQVSGVNYSRGRSVTLRLFVHPGRPAGAPVCAAGAG